MPLHASASLQPQMNNEPPDVPLLLASSHAPSPSVGREQDLHTPEERRRSPHLLPSRHLSHPLCFKDSSQFFSNHEKEEQGEAGLLSWFRDYFPYSGAPGLTPIRSGSSRYRSTSLWPPYCPAHAWDTRALLAV